MPSTRLYPSRASLWVCGRGGLAGQERHLDFATDRVTASWLGGGISGHAEAKENFLVQEDVPTATQFDAEEWEW